MKTPVAYWGISNTASLNVWEINSDDAMLVGINDDTPEWFEIQHDIDPEDEENVYAYIEFHGSNWRLDECMRVR